MTGPVKSPAARILVVDDLEANTRLLERILSQAGYTEVRSTNDSSTVLPLLQEFEPDLICLDLHMPGRDGFQILGDIQPLIEQRGYLPVLMLTGDASTEAMHGALTRGAKDFLIKPFDPTEVLLRIGNLLEARSLYKAIEGQNEILEWRVQDRTRELQESQLEVLERLAGAAEYRDTDTGRHTRRVGELSARLAEALGQPESFVEVVRRAAPLHDIGKIGIPDAILLKPGALTPAEYELMKTHTTIGASILSGGRTELIKVAEQIAIGHHEHWDGTGYPARKSGAEIPQSARLVAVADYLDALTHIRPYRPAWPMHLVIASIRRGRGSHFDPKAVEALLDSKCYEESHSTPVPPPPSPRRSEAPIAIPH